MRSSLFKLLLVLKIFLISSLAYYAGFIKFGEIKTYAKDLKENIVDNKKSNNSKQKKSLGDSPRVNRDQSSSEEETFFAKLLSFPKVKSDQIKKDEFKRYIKKAEKVKQELDNKVSIISKRKKQMLVMEKNVAKLIDKLEQEKHYFKQAVQKEIDLRQDRVKKLALFYEKMEPKKAAPIFENLNKDLAVALINLINKKQITQILQAMDSQKSNELTEYYGRVGSGQEYALLKEMNVSIQDVFKDCK